MLKVYTSYKYAPEGLYTKTKLKVMGLQPVGKPVALLMNPIYHSIQYDLYHINETIPMKKKRKAVPIVLPSITADTLCEALYIMNKSAKKSRDTKKKNYEEGAHGQVRRAKNRQNNLYNLKDRVIEKMLKEKYLSLEGYHVQKRMETIYVQYDEDEIEYEEVSDYQGKNNRHYYDHIRKKEIRYKIVEEMKESCSYLLLYTYKDYSFHLPIDEEPHCIFLGEIGMISAKVTRKITMKFTSAKTLLETYLHET